MRQISRNLLLTILPVLLTIIHASHGIRDQDVDAEDQGYMHVPMGLSAFYKQALVYQQQHRAIRKIANDDAEYEFANKISISDFCEKLVPVHQSTRLAEESRTTACLKDLIQVCKNSKTWGRKYLDSTGKKPSGFSSGALKWYGDYDQCLAIPPQYINTTKKTISSHFCHVGIQTLFGGNVTALPSIYQIFFSLMVGTCLPTTCSEDEIASVFNIFLVPSLLKVAKGYTYCYKKEYPLNIYAIVTICCFSFVGFFVLVGLLVDIFKRTMHSFKTHKKSLITIKSSSEFTEKEKLAIIGYFGSLFLCFSPLTNLAKLFTLPNQCQAQLKGPNLSCINGIRSLSLFWVILGHVYAFWPFAVDNGHIIAEMTNNWTLQFVYSGYFAVDSFFFLSGFLAYWSLSRRITKSFWTAVPYAYFHRYIRLTPPLAAVILINLGLWAYLWNGPFYFQNVDKYCADNWWAALTYVHNFYLDGGQCAGWTWYLSNDFQFFILAPFIVYAFVKKPLFGWLSCILLLLVQVVSAATLTVVYNLPTATAAPIGYNLRLENGTVPKDFIGFYEYIYIKPYTRVGPYVIGLICCHLVLHHPDMLERQLFKKWPVRWLCWIVSFGTMLAIIYSLYGWYAGEYMMTVYEDAAYNAVARTAWGVALGWVVVACVMNRAGIVNSILSWNVWALPARLSYTAYLVHPLVIYFYVQTARKPFNATEITITFTYCATLVTTLLLSTVLSLAFESPIINLMK